MEICTYWYPDFSSAKCLNDCQEPSYMGLSSGWFFGSAEDCCQQHYLWDVQNCRMNSLGEPQWYPVFDAGEGGCSNDGEHPLYMTRYDDYLFSSKLECCTHYFEWNVDGCMNPETAPDPCDYTYMKIYDADYLLIEGNSNGWYPDCEFI